MVAFNSNNSSQPTAETSTTVPSPTVTITGGGIVGLTLALALKKHVGITAEIYEQATEYRNVGAGMGLYPNGLRVLNDLDLSFPEAVPYQCRRWERHDGTTVAVAEEKTLCNGDMSLQSLGIRRCYLQQVLYKAVQDAGIPIHFGKKTVHVECLSQNVPDADENNHRAVQLVFDDGTSRRTDLLFAADGAKSLCRNLFAPEADMTYMYTGVTCLMGLANVTKPDSGISFPAADLHSHGVFFSTGVNEQCFQIHTPIPAAHADSGNWGTLTQMVGQKECAKLAEKLQSEGWHEKFLDPLRQVTHAVRIGLCLLQEPGLENFVYRDRVVLLGDAAHPPIPYIGQGAQMGIEDCGVLAMLLKRYCLDDHGVFSLRNLHPALKMYEKMRIPRTQEIRATCKQFGKRQEIRSSPQKYRQYMQDETIQREVFFHDTLPLLLPGVEYNYKDEVEKALKENPLPLPIVEEGVVEDDEEAETEV